MHASYAGTDLFCGTWHAKAAPEVTNVLLNGSLQTDKYILMNVAILRELLEHILLCLLIKELHDNFWLALKPECNVHLHSSKLSQIHQQALLLSCKAWHPIQTHTYPVSHLSGKTVLQAMVSKVTRYVCNDMEEAYTRVYKAVES